MRASEKQNRNAVACESRRSIRAASAHRRFAVRPAANLSLDTLRQFIQVRHLKSDHRFCGRAGKSCVGLARFPRVARRVRRPESPRRKQRNHFLFLLLNAQIRYHLRKILYGEEAPRPAHHRDTHRGEPRVQDILPVAGRIHPAGVNDLGIRTDGDVFGDGAEPRASFGEAAFQVQLAGELVLEHIQIEHAQGVLAGGFEEGVIPLERGETLGGALAVEGLEELALRVIPLLLRVRADRKEKEKCGGQEKFGISHGAKDQPRTRTALRLSTTWPPAAGRPKLSMGLKREKSSIWSRWRRSSRLVGPERI